MQYLLIFLIPPILFNLTWLIDTFLVSKFWEEKENWTLESWIWTLMIIWWTIAGLVALWLFPFVYKDIFTIQRQSLLYLLAWGIAYGLAAFPYFKALEKEQIENILPMYQTVPLFAYIMRILLLWETIPLRKELIDKLNNLKKSTKLDIEYINSMLNIVNKWQHYTELALKWTMSQSNIIFERIIDIESKLWIEVKNKWLTIKK